MTKKRKALKKQLKINRIFRMWNKAVSDLILTRKIKKSPELLSLSGFLF